MCIGVFMKRYFTFMTISLLASTASIKASDFDISIADVPKIQAKAAKLKEKVGKTGSPEIEANVQQRLAILEAGAIGLQGDEYNRLKQEGKALKEHERFQHVVGWGLEIENLNQRRQAVGMLTDFKKLSPEGKKRVLSILGLENHEENGSPSGSSANASTEQIKLANSIIKDLSLKGDVTFDLLQGHALFHLLNDEGLNFLLSLFDAPTELPEFNDRIRIFNPTHIEAENPSLAEAQRIFDGRQFWRYNVRGDGDCLCYSLQMPRNELLDAIIAAGRGNTPEALKMRQIVMTILPDPHLLLTNPDFYVANEINEAQVVNEDNFVNLIMGYKNNMEYIPTEVALAWGFLTNTNVYLWRFFPGENQERQMTLMGFYRAGDAAKSLHVGYGGLHFQRLVLDGTDSTEAERQLGYAIESHVFDDSGITSFVDPNTVKSGSSSGGASGEKDLKKISEDVGEKVLERIKTLLVSKERITPQEVVEEVLKGYKTINQNEEEIIKAAVLANFDNLSMRAREELAENKSAPKVQGEFEPREVYHFSLGKINVYRAGIENTKQYPEVSIPQMPVIHPYSILDEESARKNLGLPVYLYAARLTPQELTILPNGNQVTQILEKRGIKPENIEVFLDVQDDPWQGINRLLRPQYWVWPDAPSKFTEDFYSKNSRIEAAIVSQSGHKLIDPKTKKLKQNGEFVAEDISIHNSPRPILNAKEEVVGFAKTKNAAGKEVHILEDDTIISSGNSLVVQGIQDNARNLFYSIVIGPSKKVAVTLHVVLSDADVDLLGKKRPKSPQDLLKIIGEVEQDKPALKQIKLDFKTAIDPRVELEGMSVPEGWGTWSDGKEAKFTFDEDLPKNFKLTFTAFAYDLNAGKDFEIKIGSEVKKFKLSSSMQTNTLNINNIDSKDTFTIVVPEPTVPAGGNRQLGFGLADLNIEEISLDKNIDFKKDLLEDIKFTGLSVKEPHGRWSDGKTVKISLPEALPKAFTLTLNAGAYPTNVRKDVIVTVGKEVKKFRLEATARTLSIDFTNNSTLERDITFTVPSPTELKAGDRKLGIYFAELKIKGK